MSQLLKVTPEGSTIVCSQAGAPIELRYSFDAASQLLKFLNKLSMIECPELLGIKFEGDWGYIVISNTDNLKDKVLVGNERGHFQFDRKDEYRQFIGLLQEAGVKEEEIAPEEVPQELTSEPT
jgi:hypothetical protein